MATFQTHFRATDQDRRLNLTAGAAGFHGANHAITAPTAAQIVAYLATLPAASLATPPPAQPPAPRSYCWTQGVVLNPNHTSVTCSNKAASHQDAATLTNQMGGNPRM
jgi:hypothetical protein